MQYGLIGEHLGHSYSREIHRRIASYDYELRELAPRELAGFLRARAFSGINVTIPYKQAVIPFLDEMTETAREIGAVNTIVNRDGRLLGDNTDFAGMRALAMNAGVELVGAKVLVLGTGGTSRTARAVARHMGAAQALCVSRSPSAGAVSYADAARLHADADIIINTTPVGMYPHEGESPVDLTAFPALRGVLDAIYHPLRTDLVLDAQQRGIPAAGGLYMLCAQAVYAGARFLGRERPEPERIPAVFRAVLAEKRNIVLIGMPTAGKTTVGKLLARQTGRPFCDTDELICAQTGMTPADYITRNGEAAFRALERETVSALSGRSGCVIATGGGAVLDGANVRMLKRNGVLVFLDRPLERLKAAPDRPLASDPGRLAALFHARRPVYLGAADIVVDAGGTPPEAAETIMKELEL